MKKKIKRSEKAKKEFSEIMFAAIFAFFMFGIGFNMGYIGLELLKTDFSLFGWPLLLVALILILLGFMKILSIIPIIEKK